MIPRPAIPGALLVLAALLCLAPEPVRGHCTPGFPIPKEPPDRRPAGTPAERVPGSVTPVPPRWAGKGPATGEVVPRTPAWRTWWVLNRDRLLSLRAVRYRRRMDAFPPEDLEIDREPLLALLRRTARVSDPDLATSAIIALGRARDEASVPMLMELAEATDTDGAIRETAVLGVGMAGRGTKPARPFLTRLLGNADLPARLRGFAALSLGALGEQAALPSLLGRVRNPGEAAAVAEAALVAVGLIGDEIAVPDLARILQSGKAWPLRAHAALALGKLGSRRAVGVLTTTIEDPEPHVRRQAVLSLGALIEPGDEGTVGELIEMLAKSEDPRDRSVAAVALGEAGIVGAEPALLDAYRAVDSDLAAHAALGLALLSRNSMDRGVEERVRGLLDRQFREQTDVPTLRVLACAISIERGRMPCECLAGAEQTLVEGAEAPGVRGIRSQADLLRRLALESKSPELVRAAAWSLSQLPDPKSVEPLATLLAKHPLESLKGDLAVALGDLGSRGAASALSALIADEERPVSLRASAAVGLGRLLERPPPASHELLRDHVNVDVLGPLLWEVLRIL